ARRRSRSRWSAAWMRARISTCSRTSSWSPGMSYASPRPSVRPRSCTRAATSTSACCARSCAGPSAPPENRPMLRALSIRDYVLGGRLDLELASGFPALTGETGAGKSILVDALKLALGDRADAAVVRAGAQRAEISADFEAEALPAVRAWLEAQDLEEGD